MPKVKISEFSSTPANNTDIDSINIAEGCAPSGINDAIRELMAQLKDFQTGAVGDSFNGPVGTTTAAAGAFTTLAASGAVTLSGGTANGVAYLNGSKVVTSGSALTFDGTALGVSGTANNAVSVTSTATTTALKLDNTNANGWGSNLAIFTGGTAAGYFGTIGSLLGSTAQDLAIYATSSNGVRIYTNGNNERMRVTSGGDVGIGTSSPSQKLDVAGQVTISSGNGYLWGNGAVQMYSNSSYLRFRTASTDRLEIDSSGNLGLGVTPSAWATLRGLQNGRANLVGYVSNAEGAWLTNNAFYDGSWKYQVSSQATHYQQLSGVHSWHNAPSGTAGNAITFTQAMTLDASGNLALGTTSATGQSSNNRVIQIYGAGTANRAQIHFCNSDTGETATDGSFIGIDTNKNLFIINRETADTIFENNGAERARIDSSGNLLVGTTSVISAGKYSSSFAGATENGIILKTTLASTGSTYIGFVNSSGSTIGTVTQNGASTVAYNTSSDYRLKNSIAPMTGALAKVVQLKPVTYKWNADGSDGEGFIAHELAEVCPDAVTGAKDAVDEEGNPKYQGIDTSFLVATLTAALQELNAKFDAYVASHP